MITLTACQKEKQTIELNRKVLPMAESGGGFSYGLYDLNGEIETTNQFHIESGGVLNKILSFGNYYEKPGDFKILILANYQQISFEANDKKANIFHDFSVEAKDNTQIKLSIRNLPDNIYDIIILIVNNANNKSLDESFRNTTDLSNFISYRCSLVVGEPRDSIIELNTYAFNAKENNNIDAILLNNEAEGLKRLTMIECQDNKVEQFYLHVGNASDEDRTYAFVLLYDWTQHKIYENDVLYVTVPAKTMIDIPIEFSEFGEEGIHDLTIVRILMSESKESVQRNAIDNSLRIGVKVVP